MAVPALSNFVTWAGSLFNKNSWDSNIQTLVNIFSGGTYDLNVAKITATDITANSLTIPGQETIQPLFIGWVYQSLMTVVPNGWLECAGQNLPIATYEQLFYNYGHTYGPGDGAQVIISNTAASETGNVCTITDAGHGIVTGAYVSIKFCQTTERYPGGGASGANMPRVDRGVKITSATANTFSFSVEGWLDMPSGATTGGTAQSNTNLTYVKATTFPVPDCRKKYFWNTIDDLTSFVSSNRGDILVRTPIDNFSDVGCTSAGTQPGTDNPLTYAASSIFTRAIIYTGVY